MPAISAAPRAPGSARSTVPNAPYCSSLTARTSGLCGQPPATIPAVGTHLCGDGLQDARGHGGDVLDGHPPHQTAAFAPGAAVDGALFDSRAGLSTVTDDYRRLLDDPSIDVLYLAFPRDLHEGLYLDAVAAGKDFLGEKPFGIAPGAARRIVAAVDASSVFVRVSSELPFFPGAQRAAELVRGGLLGEVLEVRSGLLHSSDLDRPSPSAGSGAGRPGTT